MNTQDDTISAAELTTPEPTPITREGLIEKLIEDRGANWDYSDTCEMLEYGRTGFAEMTNQNLEEIAEDYCLCDDDGNEVRYRITDADTSKPSAETINKELLEALKRLLEIPEKLTTMEHFDYMANAERIARQAIAKAEGN